MIYLDHAATSFPKPEPVYRGMEAFVRTAGANPGRGGHRLAVEAGAMIVAQFDIVLRPGLHCAPYAHRHLGTFPRGTARLSVGPSSTRDEMLRAAAAIDEVAASMRTTSPGVGQDIIKEVSS